MDQGNTDRLEELWGTAQRAIEARDMRRLLTVWKALAAEDVWQIYSSIGLMYDRGAEGVARQPSEALFWYRKAVNAGDDPIAHVGLGRAYYEGKGVEKDVTAAYAHFENAYSAGLPESGIYLGTMYQSGLGVKMDLAKAEECFKFSADAGYFYAYFKLARIAFDRRRYLRALKLCVKGWALGVRVAKADPDDLRLLGADMSRRHDKFRA